MSLHRYCSTWNILRPRVRRGKPIKYWRRLLGGMEPASSQKRIKVRAHRNSFSRSAWSSNSVLFHVELFCIGTQESAPLFLFDEGGARAMANPSRHLKP